MPRSQLRRLESRSARIRDFGRGDLHGIESARLPGRLEWMPGTVNPPVWIDGAHNQDKLRAVTREAIRLFGGGRRQ